MTLSVVSQRPARMSLTNLATGMSVEAQSNPPELEETIDVNWARPAVPGLSHEPLQYSHTSNLKHGLTLTFDALDPTYDPARILLARRFLQSLCVPRQAAQDIGSGAPPRVLFVWPNLISLTCVITSLGFKYSRFRLDGTPTLFTVKVALEEIRDVRLTSEDVLASGTQRSGSGSA